ncbi:MAG: PIN domain-containing protein [Geobacteraceae bacterium]|nr:PIN domain-containing protein [Geobacteraceae bacterium]
MSENINYNALLIDTSIFDGNGLRLEKGLLGKLYQFRKSPIDFLMPDVIFNEIKAHLEQKIKASRSALEKSLNDAGDHLFFDGSTLNDAKKILIDSNEIENLAETRLDNFLDETGALCIDCGEYVTVSVLLKQYFSNQPPFAETGKKKNEFPDAIILMAIEKWAENEDKFVLAVAKDDDWKRYCETSKRIVYEEELSAGLAAFNTANAPYALLANLESALENETAKSFLDSIEVRLSSALDGFTPDQDADSFLYWEPEGCDAWFKEFYLSDNEFRVIDSAEDWVVLEANAVITVEAEGEFSLSMHDSIDRDYVHMGGVTANAEKEFESEILITISGDLNGPIEGLVVEDVEIVSRIKTIHFGTLEPDFGDYD